jgi:hypothetical protein
MVPTSGSTDRNSHPSSTVAGGGSARPSMTSQNGPTLDMTASYHPTAGPEVPKGVTVPAIGGTRRRLVSPRVLGHRSVVAPSEQIDSGHLVEIDTPTRN